MLVKVTEPHYGILLYQKQARPAYPHLASDGIWGPLHAFSIATFSCKLKKEETIHPFGGKED